MKVQKILPETLFAKIKAKEDLVILDVRGAERFAADHITGENVDSKNIPKGEIFALEGEEEADHSLLKKDEEMVITCTSGNSATRCAEILADKGYQVKVLTGGITAWNDFKKNR